jgi:hypothetical protein
MSKGKTLGLLAAYFGSVGSLLPGDSIHYVAPINRQSQSSADRIAQIDAANAKRARKAAKRLRDAGMA